MTDARTFPLAGMCTSIRVLTLGMLALPLVFFATAVFVGAPLLLPGAAIAALYAWTWLRMRPTGFAVSREALEVVWPLRRARIPRAEIAGVRRIEPDELRREVGFATRVGVGGLWGAFGWLWSRRRGIVRMYISRTDGFVWIEMKSGRPWLVTPAEPESFVRALAG